ncbi:alpha/beta hydrolase [Candidatus Woesearchaeota archaeon]|nr:alpha/beta hydrolase [Candidatus Woesearchaeota archaeon]
MTCQLRDVAVMWQDGYARGRDGVKIYYKFLRKGLPWLVFLHGGTGSMSAMFLQERFFSKKRFSLLFIDLRGHGYSSRGSGSEFFRLGNFAADVEAVLKKLRISKAVIIGHCFGSFVAQQFAKDFPEKVQKLILINSATRIVKLAWLKAILDGFFRFVRLIPYGGRNGHGDYSTIINTFDISPKRLLTDVRYCGVETYSHVMLESLNFSSPLEGFSKPTLLIHGKKDILVLAKRGVELSRMLRNARLVLLDTNHVSVLNDAEGVNKAILNFVNT